MDIFIYILHTYKLKINNKNKWTTLWHSGHPKHGCWKIPQLIDDPNDSPILPPFIGDSLASYV
jgi:hypothetical protein